MKEKFYNTKSTDVFNFEENKMWYSQNISFIDEKIIKISNKILKQQNIKNVSIKNIEQVYVNSTLKQLYNKEKPIYIKAISIDKQK